MGPGKFPVPGGAATDGEDTMVEVGREMWVHIGGGDDRGGGVWADGDLHLAKAEYFHVLYCDATDSGPLQGGREEEGAMVRTVVVVAGGSWPDKGKVYGGGGRGGRGWDGEIKEGR